MVQQPACTRECIARRLAGRRPVPLLCGSPAIHCVADTIFAALSIPAAVIGALTGLGIVRAKLHRPHAPAGDPALAAALDRLIGKQTRRMAAVMVHLGERPRRRMALYALTRRPRSRSVRSRRDSRGCWRPMLCYVERSPWTRRWARCLVVTRDLRSDRSRSNSSARTRQVCAQFREVRACCYESFSVAGSASTRIRGSVRRPCRPRRRPATLAASRPLSILQSRRRGSGERGRRTRGW